MLSDTCRADIERVICGLRADVAGVPIIKRPDVNQNEFEALVRRRDSTALQQVAKMSAPRTNGIVFANWFLLLDVCLYKDCEAWHFSASPHQGRCITTLDEEHLLAMAEAVGADPAASMKISTGPKAPTHWVWTEGVSSSQTS